MLPRCPWVLEKKVKGEKGNVWEPAGDHEVLNLLRKPTKWHSGTDMLAALLVDWNLGGTSLPSKGVGKRGWCARRIMVYARRLDATGLGLDWP